MEMTAANILTLARLVLTPCFVFCFVAGQHRLAFILFCVAGFTDLIDGTVARLLRQPSKGGALLDPLADKFLMQSCFTLLAFSKLLPLWFFLLAFARDAMIVGGIFYLERRRFALPYRPLLISKVATLVQLAVAIFGLLRWWQPALAPLGIALVTWHIWGIAAATVLIAVSGVGYVRMGFEILRQSSARSRAGTLP